MENKIKKYADELKKVKNIIFRGAPGTGKTYLSRQIASYIVSNGQETDYTNLTEEQRKSIGFVQFHPGYDYTDFIEGLRPIKSKEHQIQFELKQGTFYKFISSAKNSMLRNKNDINISYWVREQIDNMIKEEFYLTAPNGTDKFKLINIRTSKQNNNKIEVEKNGKSIRHQEQPTLENLIKLIKVDKTLSRNEIIEELFPSRTSGTSAEATYYKAIYDELLKRQSTNGSNISPRVFIIDEINRGELSRIFGELFFSIDPDYRGIAGSVSTQYANLHDDPNEKFYIPENVYIIGTMNDIDRSVDTFDFAMRRRFTFIEIRAENSIEMLDALDEDIKEIAIVKMKSLNSAISDVPELNENYHIGASYFLKLRNVENNFDKLWEHYLFPLLQEYVRGMINEDQILKELEQSYYVGE